MKKLEIIIKPEKLEDLKEVLAVSYTHLDVYKRQMFDGLIFFKVNMNNI